MDAGESHTSAKGLLLQFNLVRVEIRELRPKVVAEGKGYWFTTEVEPMCDKGYLLRHLLRKVEGREGTYSGSEDL